MGILDKIKKTKKTTDDPKVKDAVVEDVKKEAPKKATKTTVKKVEKKEVATQTSGKTSRAHAVLKFPHVSEKAALRETKHQYTFVVNVDADKTSIKDAVESIYGVRPKHVRTMNMDGKEVRFGTKFGRRAAWKKAVVILPKGKTINIHEGV